FFKHDSNLPSHPAGYRVTFMREPAGRDIIQAYLSTCWRFSQHSPKKTCEPLDAAVGMVIPCMTFVLLSHTGSRAMRNRYAFTLIELLVVIAIIAILIAL